MEDVKLSHGGCSSLTSKKEIFDFMLSFDGKLRSDRNFNKTVRIKHKDTSEFLLSDCHVEEDDGRIYVYTEHCGFFWFYKDDVEEMRETILSWNEGKGEYDIILDKITIFDT